MSILQPKQRIASIDILRGLVMIIMALDHTRDFFHQPAMIADPLDLSTTTPFIFLTRWITHFCAPTFVFLSGISAFLASQRKTKAEASNFLMKRGIWLILVELFIITLGITFNIFYNLIILQVIWAIGTSMFILGLLVRTSYTTIFITGLVLFFGHNIFDFYSIPTNTLGIITGFLFTSGGNIYPVGDTHLIGDFYAVLPWTGVMLLGYAAGKWFLKDILPEKRKKLLLATGFSLIGLFIILRATGLYGNPTPWAKQETLLNNVLSFINTTKYPPSLLYLSMTLGPSCILLALLENVKAKWSKVATVYGSVPFFYYVLHFYLLHTILVILFFATGHSMSEPYAQGIVFRPATFGYGLPVVYLIWISVVAILYLPCKWFSNYKKTHTQWWLSYL